MAYQEDMERIERLMKTIEEKLGVFESHITHMHNKLEELNKQDCIYFVNKLNLNRVI